MKLARKILVKILGLKAYLKLVSRTYIRMIRNGKMKDKYPELYFVKQIVSEGDTILDIGANLGYYSYFMAKYAGKSGKVLAVEPIPLFAEIWQTNMKAVRHHGVQLHNCALGSEAKPQVKMSIPIVDGVVRHGLTKVAGEEGIQGASYMDYSVPMRVGDELISSTNIEKLDYIKCDVEGYEQFVMPSLDKTIDLYKPFIQIELSGDENRKNVVDFLLKKSYQMFILKGDFLNPIQKNDIFSVDQDFYFIHPDHMNKREHLIRK
ncbi:FkbM family methyltransferase [Paracrocinitomix mangrovi]|uniref:FkbM family methyltransferase n=1 Tax=Paracrocinitomix mangrovi TaxID=2862509 RepID=UPI001C8E7B6D|nr:FkbM family methyltransferase [Paracrocinitomix mangrovi]UKN02787.1 FkbM family methyltransferase [Paracrocinitomix mangrovi]